MPTDVEPISANCFLQVTPIFEAQIYVEPISITSDSPMLIFGGLISAERTLRPFTRLRARICGEP